MWGRRPPPPPPPPPPPSSFAAADSLPLLVSITAFWLVPILLYFLAHRGSQKKSMIQKLAAFPKRRPIVGANWKCNPASVRDLDSLVSNVNSCDCSKCDVYVCPSPLHAPIVVGKFTNGAEVSSQNCNFAGCGAYTGEMAVEQMKSLGFRWALIGHSERRGEFGLPTPAESPTLLARKLKHILDGGLNCVFCIGEPLEVRKQGLEAVLSYCAKQLIDILPLLEPSRVVIAYEPVWSIGTGVTATPEQAQETHAALRCWLAEHTSVLLAAEIRLQYGGSANAKNAPALAACPDVDGFLVGSASLKPEFAQIVASVAAAKGSLPRARQS